MINKISSVSYTNTKKRINSNQNIDKVTFEKKKVTVGKINKKKLKKNRIWNFIFKDGVKLRRGRLKLKDTVSKPPAF